MAAIRTDAVYHVIDEMGVISVGYGHGGNGNILNAEGPVAIFTEKMDMAVKCRMPFGRVT